MSAIDKFDYAATRGRAKWLLKKLKWNLKEEHILIDDMVQSAALALIEDDDETRFSFIIGNALMDTVLEWRFNVRPATHKTRQYRGQDDVEPEPLSKFLDLDFSSFKLHNYSLDVERVVMARECIRKIASGNLEPLTDRNKGSIDLVKRRDACSAILENGSENIRDGRSNRAFGHKVLRNVNKLVKKLIVEHI